MRTKRVPYFKVADRIVSRLVEQIDRERDRMAKRGMAPCEAIAKGLVGLDERNLQL